MSTAQLRALAILPKITGWTSFALSGIVAATVLRDRKRRSLCYHRLVCGISIVDMSASLWLGMSTWPIPKESGALWAVGSQVTCRVQAFFTQFGISSSFYNASLSIYFYLVIVKGWKESQLQKIEWMLHMGPLLWAFSSSLTGLVLDVFANATLWCWVSKQQDAFRWGAFYGPLWCMILVVTCSCLAVFRHVRRLEMNTQKHRLFQNAVQQEFAITQPPAQPVSSGPTFSESTLPAQDLQERTAKQQQTRSRVLASYSRHSSVYRRSRRVKDVAHQCFLYAAAFYINWAALTVRIFSESLLKPTGSQGNVFFLYSRYPFFFV